MLETLIKHSVPGDGAPENAVETPKGSTDSSGIVKFHVPTFGRGRRPYVLDDTVSRNVLRYARRGKMLPTFRRWRRNVSGKTITGWKHYIKQLAGISKTFNIGGAWKLKTDPFPFFIHSQNHLRITETCHVFSETFSVLCRSHQTTDAISFKSKNRSHVDSFLHNGSSSKNPPAILFFFSFYLVI